MVLSENKEKAQTLDTAKFELRLNDDPRGIRTPDPIPVKVSSPFLPRIPSSYSNIIIR